jgi:hypothetical protein
VRRAQDQHHPVLFFRLRAALRPGKLSNRLYFLLSNK